MKKYIGLVISAIFLLGLLTAIKLDVSLGENLCLLFPLKLLYIMPLFLAAMFLLSLLGLPAYIFYLLFDVFTVGFLFSIFFKAYQFKGLLYFGVYFLLIKIPLIFLLILNIFYSFKYAKAFYRFIFNRFGQSIRNIKLYFKKMLIINIIFYFLVVVDVFLLSKLMTLLANHLFF